MFILYEVGKWIKTKSSLLNSYSDYIWKEKKTYFKHIFHCKGLSVCLCTCAWNLLFVGFFAGTVEKPVNHENTEEIEKKNTGEG